MFSARPRLAGTLVGLLVTIASTAAMHGVSYLRGLELQAFDLRMRMCNTLEAASPIIHIDIDDGSLERVGRWPWNRDKTADVIRVLHELGASQIMVDLLFSEAESDYYDEPSIHDDPLADMISEIIGERSEANRVYPDLELAHAIRTSGNVILAAQLETIGQNIGESLKQRLGRLYEDDSAMSVDAALSACGLPDSELDRQRVDRELLRLRIREHLLADFTIDESQLARLLNETRERIAAVIAGAKRATAEELALAKLRRDRSATRDAVKSAILGERSHLLNADARDVEAAYDTARGLIALRDRLRAADPAVRSRLSRSTNVVPLRYSLAEAARDIVAVSFDPDPDGVVRRVPILVSHDGGVVPHMGLAAAAHVLNLNIPAATMPNDRTLVIPTLDGTVPLRLPLDGRGNLIIHWTRTASDWHRGADFDHVPAAKIWMPAAARREMRQNNRLIGHLTAEVVAAAKGTITRIVESPTGTKTIVERGDLHYREKVNRWLTLNQKIHLAELTNRGDDSDTRAWREESARLREEIEREHESAASDVELNCADLDAFSAEEIEQDDELKALSDRFLRARRLLQEEIPALRRANESLARSIEETMSELAPRVRGRSVFIGYAATAEGDIVSTPISPQTNGVMCHAQVLNSILQRRVLNVPPLWFDIAICLVAGALAGYVTATRGPAVSLPATAALLAGYWLLNAYALFQSAGWWIAVAPTIVTVFIVWAFVTLFRQLTAERDKRHFRKQLSQYTSPAIAAKIAESPEAARAFKAVQTRDMSCLFSDLQGFTSITEREDAEVVQHVLNVYLERMSEAIWSHRGLINKFMGDGIMAIFNPSVDPLPSHERAACEAGLFAMEELERLKQERQAAGDSPVFAQLRMRLGIASGLCKNGDLGSELKADYTVIGDVVNLAARLEPANKVFGTSILVSGPLRDRVREWFEFRYLAELQVKGKSRTVPVYEMLGRAGSVDTAALEYARAFEAGVELYKQRNWDACIDHFTRMLARRPDDAGAIRYIEACKELRTFGPDAAWCGALELKEK